MVRYLISAFFVATLVPLSAAELFLLPMRENDVLTSVADLSARGHTAVGYVRSRDGDIRAAAWYRTPTGYRRVVLKDLKEGATATAVSDDGSVIVGWVKKNGRRVAARWVDGVLDVMEGVTGKAHRSEAVAVSDNGKVIVCNRSGKVNGAVVWSKAGGVRVLQDLGEGHPVASCISGDGRIVGGYHLDGHETSSPVIWKDFVAVKMASPKQGNGEVRALSRDGEVIAGRATTENSVFPGDSENGPITEQGAVVWNSSGDFQVLGGLPDGEIGSRVSSVDASGDIVVGSAAVTYTYYQIPTIWVGENGPVSLEEYLQKFNPVTLDENLREYPVDLSDYDLQGGALVSSSGEQFAGNIEDEDDYVVRSWIVDTRNSKKPEISVMQQDGSELEDGEAVESFGLYAVGSRSMRKKFTIENTGDGKLRDLSIALRGKDASSFGVSSLRVKSLAPGETTTISVFFKPQALGDRTCSLRIKSNDSDENPFVIKLSGTGIRRKN